MDMHAHVHVQMAESEEPMCNTSQEEPGKSVSKTDSGITEKTASLLD